MASVGEPTTSKRPHMLTERMQEFIKTHGDVSPQKQQKCPHDGCSKVLSSVPGLRYHIQTYHSQVKEFVCPKCSRTFRSANGLKYHTGKTKCEDCHAGGNISSALSTNEDNSENTCGVAGQGSADVKNSDSKAYTETQGKRVPPPLILKSESIVSPDNVVTSSNGTSNNFLDVDRKLSRTSCPLDVSSRNTTGTIGSLEEFAIFATSPQSPLMQRAPVKPWDIKPMGSSTVVRCLNDSFGMSTSNDSQQDHSYSFSYENDATQNNNKMEKNCNSNETGVSPTLDNNGNYFSDGSDPRVTSSSPFPTSPKNLSSPTDTWSHQWPTAVWQCFTEGTRINFLNDSGNEWKKVEDLARLESLQESASWTGTGGSNNTDNRYGHGLKLLRIDHHQNVDNIKESVTQLHFTSNIPGEPDLIAECSLDHPFFVKDKGWSSYHPHYTAEHYGIPCNILEVNDVCLPPTHPDAVLGDDMLESFISSDLTPMDSSAVFTLQNMAKQRRDLELSPKSNPGSPTKKRLPKTEPSKAKRPMNAFMLFAKEFRLEYTQKYPGKDNRAISVMLGDTWKKMNMQERNLYAEKARSLADVQKKMYPDCWKRKK